jgi:outer membrane protein OmpA-like peptidoglycan-associated protein
MSPLLGAAVGLPGDTVRPWLQLNVGTGFTGGLIRPMLRGEVGVDLRLSSAFTLGPALGYSQVFQSDGPRYTTDARFLWFGLVIGLDPQKSHRVTHREHLATEQHTVSRRNIVTQTQQPTEPEPEPEALPEANPPSPELLTLIENTFPTQRNEWLAPVLFNFDSAELKPQGIAMLHEVARELVRRPKLKLLEIQGYADSRGPSEHNRKLSERRASAVLAWLVSHGIERKRLRVAARGAADFVEPGRDESEHEQNRRVVFRVIEPPAN